VFSSGALFLAAVGLYGLVAYVIGLSRREIAIRLALGASGARVTGLIVRNAMVLVMAGIILGTGGAIGAGRALESQLFQTSRTEPASLAGVALLLIAVTFAASLVPTRRAVGVEPHSALRSS
jgi:ABC-type antimicrobial peptide transport system permease subunit